MKVIDAIKGRRSIRRFRNAGVTRKRVLYLLDAARWAPSGLNNQPWRFLTITEPGIKNGLSRFTRYSQVLKSSPVVICVFLDRTASYDRDKDILSIGACIQNILLAAYEMGLGTCWLGEILRQKTKVIKYLKIPASNELMAVVALGYPAEKHITGRRKPIRKLVLNMDMMHYCV